MSLHKGRNNCYLIVYLPCQLDESRMTEFKKNDKKVIRAWVVFDWANSAYALVISTAIFPVYFIANTPDFIDFIGLSIPNSAFYSYAIAFAYVIIAISSPILSGMADFGKKRLFFLKLFTIIGSLSCITLYFFKGIPELWLGTSAFIMATIGFAGGIVFYNAYLPQIVTEDRFDRVSAKGFAYGYMGSVILLAIILFMVLKPSFFGIEDEKLPARIGFVMVGLWWLIFAQYTFKHLPQGTESEKVTGLLSKGFNEIKEVYQKLKPRFNVKIFLLAFFFYSAGVQTIINLATVFAEKELNFSASELILIVLILQLVAIGGAYLFAYISKITGNKFSLSLMVIIWILICIGAYFCQGKGLFFVLAAFVGLVMGGIQALSRSSYAKMINESQDQLTSYFSFYDVLYKGSLVIGTFLFGFVNHITGNIRYSVLALGVLFVVSFVLLRFVNFKTAMKG